MASTPIVPSSAAARPKPPARLLTAVAARRLSPNMIRVTFGGESLAGLPERCNGAHFKLLTPELGEARAAFEARLRDGPKPATRTYTIRDHRAAAQEMDVDFVDHGDAGPGSAWARRAGPGAFCGFLGPGPVKVERFEADWYLLAADLSATPVAAAALEEMPRDARGVAVFEVPTLEDRQEIAAPAGVEIHWLETPDATAPSTALEHFVRDLEWPEGRVQTCIAGEAHAIRALRRYVLVERRVPKADAYISGYWKFGLVEDEHRQVKQAEAREIEDEAARAAS